MRMLSMSCHTHMCLVNMQNELCVAAGPGKDMFDSTDIIGQKQFSKGMVSLTLEDFIEEPLSPSTIPDFLFHNIAVYSLTD